MHPLELKEKQHEKIPISVVNHGLIHIGVHCQGRRTSIPDFLDRHAVIIIQTFGEFKRWLVEQMGFGDMLKLPDLQKLNLKCSIWIMSKVSVSHREIVLSLGKVLKFAAKDMHKVFAIPYSHRTQKGEMQT